VPSSGRCSSATDAGTTPTDAGTPTQDSGTGTTDAGTSTGGTLKAFPGAEGFGAVATGGRGGRVVYVTNLNASGAGSLAEALSASGPRYVVFRVSGVIQGPVSITQGDVTIAGQTSPGGVIVRGGIYCDNVYDANNCRNVVLRHIRSRQSNDDTLRITGGERIMVDHCSFANASDESIEVTRSQNVTVQYSTLAEPVGDHYQWGGLLVNYSKDRFPLDNLSFHHNVWNGVYGRLPELSCEENTDGPGTSNCAGRTLHAEISNNLIFDAGDPLWYNRCVGVNEGNWCSPSSRDFLLGVNWVGNVMALRTSSSQPMFVPDVSQNTRNALFYTDNLLKRGTSSQAGTATLASRSARFGYPALTLHAASGLQALLQINTGAFPRDPMDTRLAGYLSNSVDSRPASWSGGQGINRGDALRTNFTTAPSAPVDTDNDGMPDSWETANGLNPNVADHNGTGLSVRFTGVSGYTNLECYLNQLAETRVRTNQ
jgi:hypothetical protein